MTFTLLKTMLSQTVSASAPSPSGRLGGARSKIYDVNGRIVYEQELKDKANQLYDLQVELNNGIYLIEVSDVNSNMHYKQKIVITN
jgi:hypothetical protein